MDVTVTGFPDGLTPSVELAVYRIVQEALTNVLRHAGPGARVQPGLDYTGDRVRVSVVDDGGTGPSRATPTVRSPSAGHGLIGMRERVNVHGGELVEHLHRAGTPADIVVMDIRMPVMDGVAATRQLVRSEPRMRHASSC